jgi:hypothetical protein
VLLCAFVGGGGDDGDGRGEVPGPVEVAAGGEGAVEDVF